MNEKTLECIFQADYFSDRDCWLLQPAWWSGLSSICLSDESNDFVGMFRSSMVPGCNYCIRV